MFLEARVIRSGGGISWAADVQRSFQKYVGSTCRRHCEARSAVAISCDSVNCIAVIATLPLVARNDGVFWDSLFTLAPFELICGDECQPQNPQGVEAG
jgi:hypothetical protein